MELSGRHAIVCGSTQGIGFETAQLMAARGARLTLVARDGKKLEKCVAELQHNNGVTHDF